MSELPKAYEPQEVESHWYQAWLDNKCFEADPDSSKQGYSIVIPPPNVTGILHLGHMLNNTIQDLLARRARQKGKEVLWLPGTDHAGIATQTKVSSNVSGTGRKSTVASSVHNFVNSAVLVIGRANVLPWMLIIQNGSPRCLPNYFRKV